MGFLDSFFGKKAPPRTSLLQISSGLNAALQRDREEFWDVFVSNFQKLQLRIAPSPVQRPRTCDLALRSFQQVSVIDWVGARNFFGTREEAYEFLDLVTAGLFGVDLPATEEYVRAFSGMDMARRGLLLSSYLLSGLGHKFTDLNEDAQAVFVIFPTALFTFAARNLSSLFGDDEGVKLADKLEAVGPQTLRGVRAGTPGS